MIANRSNRSYMVYIASLSAAAVLCFSGFSFAANGSWSYGSGYIYPSSASPAFKLGIGFTGTPRNLLDVKGGAVFGNAYAGAQTAPANGLLVEGNVGIGVTAISSGVKLDVNGTIKANKIQIKTWTMEVPDYVFAPNYKLATLKETETFIKKNNHLPGVPSAKTLNQDGMNLAEMNLILLKKVEELTLHVIRQEKEILRISANGIHQNASSTK